METYCSLFNLLLLFSRIDGSATQNDADAIIKMTLMAFIDIVVNIQYFYTMEHENIIYIQLSNFCSCY